MSQSHIDHDRDHRIESELILHPLNDITAWTLIFGPLVGHADQSIEQTPDGMHRDGIHGAVSVCSPV